MITLMPQGSEGSINLTDSTLIITIIIPICTGIITILFIGEQVFTQVLTGTLHIPSIMGGECQEEHTGLFGTIPILCMDLDIRIIIMAGTAIHTGQGTIVDTGMDIWDIPIMVQADGIATAMTRILIIMDQELHLPVIPVADLPAELEDRVQEAELKKFMKKSIHPEVLLLPTVLQDRMAVLKLHARAGLLLTHKEVMDVLQFRNPAL
jgi:hypothetical protein